MSYSPYIPNIDVWKDHFKNPPKENKRFYTIGRVKHHGQDMDPIKLVTPTEQVVEQAKSTLKRSREMDDFLPPYANFKKRKISKKVVKKSTKTKPKTKPKTKKQKKKK